MEYSSSNVVLTHGFLAHYGRRATAALNKIFPNQWIGHGEPIS